MSIGKKQPANSYRGRRIRRGGPTRKLSDNCDCWNDINPNIQYFENWDSGECLCCQVFGGWGCIGGCNLIPCDNPADGCCSPTPGSGTGGGNLPGSGRWRDPKQGQPVRRRGGRTKPAPKRMKRGGYGASGPNPSCGGVCEYDEQCNSGCVCVGHGRQCNRGERCGNCEGKGPFMQQQYPRRRGGRIRRGRK